VVAFHVLADLIEDIDIEQGLYGQEVVEVPMYGGLRRSLPRWRQSTFPDAGALGPAGANRDPDGGATTSGALTVAREPLHRLNRLEYNNTVRDPLLKKRLRAGMMRALDPGSEVLRCIALVSAEAGSVSRCSFRRCSSRARKTRRRRTRPEVRAPAPGARPPEARAAWQEVAGTLEAELVTAVAGSAVAAVAA
jgi:hypothetical protein